MSHLSSDTLWDLGQPGARVDTDAQAHLINCEECRVALDDIKFAQNLLVPSEPPPLSDVSAKRIGDALFEAAAKQALQRPWWKALWPFDLHPGFGFAAVAAALIAVAVYSNRPPPTPTEMVATPTPQPVTPPAVPEQPRVVETPPTRFASVTSAHNATEKKAPVKKAQQVSEGATVATAKGGALWMKLPDGSRAGLAGSSQVTLGTLEDKAVKLDLGGGSLVVAAKHRPERVLTVRAGDIEVVDVGTRFLVSRDVKRVLVAVEEGAVEIRTPGGKSTPLSAGHAMEWKDGKLTEQTWSQTADEPKPTAVAKPLPSNEPSTPDIPTGDEVAAVAPSDEKNVDPPPPTPQPVPHVGSPDEWATPENLAAQPDGEKQAPTAALLPDAPQPESVNDDADESFIKKMENKLRRLRAGVQQGFAPAGMHPRAAAARDIQQLADDHSCAESLRRAELWLRSTPAGGDDVKWKRTVLRSQVRCLNELGRPQESKAVEAQLQNL